MIATDSPLSTAGRGPVADGGASLPSPGTVAAPHDDKAFVRLEGVRKTFGETVAVEHVDLSIGRGELFALLGSSGCGKSTLLRMIAGLEPVSEGRILLDGEDVTHVPPYRRPVNTMFQSYALFPHMNVFDNIAFGLKQDRVPKDEIHARVHDVLALVQLRDFGLRKPHQLSGGQQQRVALARSLVKRPKLLLLDEPMSALDKQIRRQTQIELVNIVAKVGVTCILVTHDQEEAMTMAQRIAVMRAGRIVQLGAPQEVYEFPNSRFTAEFIGSTNLFAGTVQTHSPDGMVVVADALAQPIVVRHAAGQSPGDAVTISVRPERISLSREQPDGAFNWVAGTLAHVAYIGGHTLFHIALAGGMTLVADIAGQAPSGSHAPTTGDAVFASWSTAAGVVLAD